MALFLSTFTNKVDKKGRVSVPKPFRAAVSGSDFKGVVVYRPYQHPCIEGADVGFLEKLSDRAYTDISPFDDEKLSVATSILSESVPLTFDPEGRVMLPEHFRKSAGISNQATFAGIGQKFQIWEPEAYKKHIKEQREAATKRAKTMKPILGDGQGGAR